MKKIVKVFASVLACVGLILTVTSCAGGINEVKTTYRGEASSVSGEGTENGITKTVEFSFSDVTLDYIETQRGDNVVLSYRVNKRESTTGGSDFRYYYDGKEYYTLYKDSEGLFINALVPVETTLETTGGGTTNTEYDYTYTYKKIRVKKDREGISFTIPELYELKYDPNHTSSYSWFENEVVDIKFTFTEN